MSATRSWSGREAVKSRSTRSGGRGADGSGTVVPRLRRALVSVPLPRASDGRIVLAADVSPTARTAPLAGAST
ncbi:hypothetical protein ACFC09_42510 [Streptomyces sp. NPDC056161]|uniref:hypothetical protein n=1 Tax=Streptomyces sp. NPDC056161 TaxID=3345732 RepID=UPI0035DD3B90